jgi:DNA repair protein RadC
MIMEAVKTNYPTLATETFSHGRKHYFIDVKKASNDSHFVLITSSEQFANDPQYYRRTIQLWEEDLAKFVEALSMVLGRLAYGELESQQPAMEVLKDPKGVKALAEYDRPREKLHALGARALTAEELLAILLCTGTSELSVLDLCKKMMRSLKGDLAGMLEMTAEQLCSFPGIGVAKAATLMAALELGRRAFLPAKY